MVGDRLARVGVGEGAADVPLNVEEGRGMAKVLGSKAPLSRTCITDRGSYRPRRLGLEIEFRMMAMGGVDKRRLGIDANGLY